jgi:hypothetical protein
MGGLKNERPCCSVVEELLRCAAVFVEDGFERGGVGSRVSWARKEKHCGAVASRSRVTSRTARE